MNRQQRRAAARSAANNTAAKLPPTEWAKLNNRQRRKAIQQTKEKPA